MKRKYLFLFTFISIALIGELSASGGVSISPTVTYAPPDGSSNKYTVRYSNYIKNDGVSDVTILLFSKEHTSVTARKIIFIANVAKSPDGAVLKPSLYEYNPVTLKPGESAALPEVVIDATRDEIGKLPITLVYFIDPEFARFHGVWSGRIVLDIPLSIPDQDQAEQAKPQTVHW